MIRRGADCIWISWQHHRRTESLVERLAIPLHVFTSSRPRIVKHPVFLVRTVYLLLRVNPRVVIVQNPSAVLALLAIMLRPLLRFRLVVDAHNAGVYPFESGHQRFAALFPFLHRKSDITIVTNSILARMVESNGGRAFVLPDALPRFLPQPDRYLHETEKNAFIVTFICTYSSDEPYLEVIEASNLLPDDVVLLVTGNPDRMNSDERAIADSSRATFLGFLPEDEYVATLASSDVVMDLTNFPDCLVCGAYEAVSLDIPLILSDTPASRGYFTSGVIYTDHAPENIAHSVLEARDRLEELRSDVNALHQELEAEWAERLVELRSILEAYRCKGSQSRS